MQDLTTGPLTRHLLKTTGFMLVTMVFQTLYFLIDLYWVGRLGTEAVAAVGVAGNLSFIVLALTQMLGVGTTTVVSHAVGRKDHALAKFLFNQSQVLSMVAGAVFLVLGLAFLVPGVVSPELPRAFATAAAYGDVAAAALALLSLLSLQSAPGLLAVWIFNVWGSVDLVNAFYQANASRLSPGQLGATYFIPTLIVPLLLITHGLAFRVLLQHQPRPAMGQSRQPALG